ncbi:cell division protein ZapA [Lottiidibacillus patelloidae]|uniref:Cell division protein ZapA n=1 Tax=Lottiidibacillus patelloidae TaxID=2670334 RepID=A0A263BW33_9BACI|nr:cell division protein ZapA [Lottiidibacillus patelloidae]OZM57925.1 cell division protein ZapA [Lottiidibacillus patelloidae]
MDSKDEKKRTVVDIYGHQYTIVGSENSYHVKAVAELVDSKMRSIQTKNTYIDTKTLAVLTAVNIANDYLKLKDEYERLQQKNSEKERENYA